MFIYFYFLSSPIKDSREHNVKVVVGCWCFCLAVALAVRGIHSTVRTVLGGNSRVVVCNRLGGEVWTVTTIELIVHDWFCIN